ncbi:MAG: SOS response-associated peptidase [bacterium]
MCGRFSLYFFPDAEREFEERFGIPFPTFDYPASYNISPGTNIPTVKSDENDNNQVKEMFWGLIAPFSAEFKPHPKYKMSNTRVESFDKKKADFRKKLLSISRCVVPANNYFEWARIGTGKVPFKVELKHFQLMSFGGIYSVWLNKKGEKFYSCSIITVPANRLLEKIHPRMPFILDRTTERMWLDNAVTDYEVLRDAIRQIPDEGLQCFPVSRKVNSTKNNSPDLVVPLTVLHQGGQDDLFR